MTDDSYSTGSNYLDALHEMTEAAQKQMRDTMSRSQDVVVDAVSAWSQSVQKLIPASMPTELADGPPKPADLVDSGFKIAEQLLAAQHEFARRLLHAVQPAAEAVTDTAAAAGEAASDTTDGAVKQTIRKMRGSA